MPKSTVYFTNELTPEAVVKMYRQLGIELPGKVAVKVHSGEDGNQNYLHPEFMKPVIDAVNGTEDDPERVVDERGLRQVTDTGALEPIVDEVLARCADQVQQYHDGNKKVIGFLVGQCMKAAKGSGNPKLFNQLLVQKLG